MKVILKSKPKLVVRFKGGTGSGNFGHSGRPGHVGGSGGGSVGGDIPLQKAHDQVDALKAIPGEDDEVYAKDVFPTKSNSPFTLTQAIGRDAKKYIDVEVPAEEVIKFTASQNYIPRKGLHAYIDNPPTERYGKKYVPEVVKYEGQYHIVSGHTRLAAAIFRGDDKVEIRLFEASVDTSKPAYMGALKYTKPSGY